jgi:hypothetical protein
MSAAVLTRCMLQAVAVVKRLLALAAEIAKEEDEVITTKKVIPPTGDKRTYVSLATYCWPSNPDNLEDPQGPWTCKDGHPFPGVRASLPSCMCMHATCSVRLLRGAAHWRQHRGWSGGACMG